MADNIADFLTFISPICILVLFFMCFFRFLFRSCECGIQSGDDIESCPSSRPTSSTIARIHPSCQIHPDFNPFGEFVIHCPAHCEETFPPKYEDALKMAVCTARSEASDTRRLSIPAATRPSVSSPPPFYSDHEINAQETASINASELPPAYTTASQAMFASISRASSARRPSLVSRPATGISEDSIARVSLAEIFAHVPSAPTPSRATSLSALSSNRRGPPRVHLPGAVIENEEDEYSDVVDELHVPRLSPEPSNATQVLRHTASW